MISKNVMLILLLCCKLNLNAQSLKYLGIESGLNKEFSRLGKYDALDNKISFAPALIAEFHFGKRINLRTGVNYFNGGFSYNSFTPSNIPINVRAKINTLNVPILASLPIHVNNKLQLLINFGTNIYVATSGKIIETGYWNSLHKDTPLYIKSRNIKFGSDSTNYKRISNGLNLGFGARMFNFLELNTNYIYGLSNYTNGSTKNSRKNLSIGVIYYFYRKPIE